MFNRDALKTAAFSWECAHALALASQAAYAEQPDLPPLVIDDWGFEGCEPIDIGTHQAFVAWDADSVLVAFRGTESIGDWLVDLNVTPEARPYGRVHEGFYEAWNAVRTRLDAALTQAGADAKQLWLTGHSLGGALAVIMAAELVGQRAVTGLYTYGQPKATAAGAADFVDANYPDYYRLVNDDDIVPRVPPGYRHAGDLYWFDGQGNVRQADAAVRGIEGTEGTEAIEGVEATRDLTDAEFAALQLQLDGLATTSRSAVLTAGADSDEPALFETRVRGLLPGVRDHDIARYIEQILLQLA